ncbi:MAG: MFS transporter [candidate division NC10 bacterium]
MNGEVRRHSGQDTLWLVGISGVMLLVQLPFASYVAALPLIREEWGLSNTQAGTIYSTFLAGMALAALVVIPLTDRFPPRRLFIASVWGSVITNLLFPLWAMDFLTGVLLRFVAGPCLVGVYVPGIRIVSEYFARGERGRAVGLFISAFHLGIAVSLAVMSLLLPHFGWRTAYLIAGVLAFTGVVLAHVLLRPGIGELPDAPRSSGWLSLEPLRSKSLVLITAGYAFHAWELYVIRVWLPPFLAAVLLARGLGPTQAAASGAGAAAIMLAMGAAGPFLGGLLSDRIGRTAAGIVLLSVSGAISFLIGWMTYASWGMLLGLGTVYGFASAADSAIYSTGVTELADPGMMGSAQAFHTFFGYGAAMLGPIVCGRMLDLAPPGISWGLGFSTAGVAAVLGVIALLWLKRLPESDRMAHGKR